MALGGKQTKVLGGELPAQPSNDASSDSMIDAYRQEIATQTAEVERLREEIRLREESQIPVIPHGAAVQLERLQVENEQLREALAYYAEGRYPDGGEFAREALSRV